jgi:DnaK suppressor protein
MVLTQEQQEALRVKLEAERRRIGAKSRDALGFAMGRDPERVGRDSIDASVEEGLYSTELRLHDREKKLLTKIDEALIRLESGDINECEDCGDEIGFERLMARPVTTLCVPCKEDREAGEAASGSSTGVDTFLREE